MIAYCGLKCDSCPIFLATCEHEKSMQLSMRKSIAETINSLYRLNLQYDDINDCDGCQAHTGRLFQGCSNCTIRVCASSKKLKNCAYCAEYPCEILRNNFQTESESQKLLEEIRKSISENPSFET